MLAFTAVTGSADESTSTFVISLAWRIWWSSVWAFRLAVDDDT